MSRIQFGVIMTVKAVGEIFLFKKRHGRGIFRGRLDAFHLA